MPLPNRIATLTDGITSPSETLAMADLVHCHRCSGQGGEPGSNFGDHGWHPCFTCGEVGYVTPEVLEAFEPAERLAVQEAAREASRPGWAHPGYGSDETSFIDLDQRPDDGEELPF